TTNLAANVVSPANDFSNVAPRLISFRMGGLITAVIGVVMMPWKLLASSQGYIFTWLVGYSALLGPIGGILIADYFVMRRRELAVDDLYRRGGLYEYKGGVNPAAIAALVAGVLPNVPGFLAQAFPAAVPHGAADAVATIIGPRPRHAVPGGLERAVHEPGDAAPGHVEERQLHVNGRRQPEPQRSAVAGRVRALRESELVARLVPHADHPREPADVVEVVIREVHVLREVGIDGRLHEQVGERGLVP